VWRCSRSLTVSRCGWSRVTASLRPTSNSEWSGTRRWCLTDCAGSVAKSPFRTGPESTLSA